MEKPKFLSRSYDIVSTTSWQEILGSGKPINAAILREYLLDSYLHLITEPGPNLDLRIELELSENWLTYWVDYLKAFEHHQDLNHAHIVPFEKLSEVIKVEKENAKVIKVPEDGGGASSGVLFVGGLEGHEGHRLAVDWMLRHVNVPVVLFEQDEYFSVKERKRPYLPLEVRLSMWSYYNRNLFMSVLPLKEEGVSDREHYQNLFDRVYADFCFATSGDPHEEEKRGRGKEAYFTLIPYRNVPRTTLRVQKLF
jgi:hypothetical protein